jgi:hypothetical protein
MKKIERLFALLFISSINLVYADQSTIAAQTNNINAGIPLATANSQVNDIAKRDILEDTNLINFINKIKVIVRSHDWNAFIGLCSQEHYKSQMSIGSPDNYTKTNYIVDAMSLHMVDNSIYTNFKEESHDFKALEKIEDIKIFSIDKNADEVILKGKIILKNGKKLNLEIILVYNIKGGYKISGAVG